MAERQNVKKAGSYKLVIVESPTKEKAIEKFLGEGFHVTASNGHLIDLPKSKMGVDIENNFEPNYIVIRGKTPLLDSIKKLAAKAEEVYLATDPDREGEAISWHIAKALKIPEDKQCRIEFHEITKNAVLKGLKNPRSIDIQRVNAQQARRVLDRLVGYQLSPLLWRKVRRGLSAGRVQSVVVRLIVDREEEIKNFVPEEYWTITAIIGNNDKTVSLETRFVGKDGKKIVPANAEEVEKILTSVKDSLFTVDDIKETVKQRRPFAPFTTSTMQQDASRKLGFTSKKTMMVAQGLYEGVKLGTETVGLITYMRTDSTRISEEARNAARDYIQKTYGPEYVPEKPNLYAGKKNAQDAHEGIRPTYIKYTPDKIKKYLNADQFKLYQLIYTRFLASQMTPARYRSVVVDFDAAGYTFRASFSKLLFPGCRAVYQDMTGGENGEDDVMSDVFPDLKKGEKYLLEKIDPKQNFTVPPARYTEASLVKLLDEKGIGRPSTYAPIISTIIDKQYVVREQKNFKPTDLGVIVTDLMKKNFSDIVNVEFTAAMEDKLDDVESEGKDWKALLKEFYDPFEEELERAEKEVERVKLPERPAGITCEKCGAEMVYKSGRFGEFIACPNYPACKHTLPIKNVIKTPCPLCGGQVVQRKSKKGNLFYGCDNYPECSFVSWDMPIEETCSVCGAYMVLKKRGNSKATYKKCSNPDCVTNTRSSKEESAETESAEKTTAARKTSASKTSTKKSTTKSSGAKSSAKKTTSTKKTAKKTEPEA